MTEANEQNELNEPLATPQFEALPLPSQGRVFGIPDWTSR